MALFTGSVLDTSSRLSGATIQRSRSRTMCVPMPARHTPRSPRPTQTAPRPACRQGAASTTRHNPCRQGVGKRAGASPTSSRQESCRVAAVGAEASAGPRQGVMPSGAGGLDPNHDLPRLRGSLDSRRWKRLLRKRSPKRVARAGTRGALGVEQTPESRRRDGTPTNGRNSRLGAANDGCVLSNKCTVFHHPPLRLPTCPLPRRRSGLIHGQVGGSTRQPAPMIQACRP